MSTHTPPLTIRDFGGEPTIFMRYPDPTDQRWSAFNPSIARSADGRYGMTIRSSNYVIPDKNGMTMLNFGTYIKTRTWFAIINPETLGVDSLREVHFSNPTTIPAGRGAEDARLFWRDGSWYFTAVVYEPPTINYARMVLYRYDEETSRATFVEMLKAPRENRSEKNWMAPDVATPNFDYIYSSTQTYKDGELHGIYNDMQESISDQKYLSSIRGGSGLVLQEDGTYLAVVHDVSVQVTKSFNPASFGMEVVHKRDYQHYFARYSAEGRLTHLSPAFLFKKEGIEYAAGLVEYGDDMIISFGARDVFAGMSKVPKYKIVESLQPIGVDL